MQKRFLLLVATIFAALSCWAQGTGTYSTDPSPLNADKEGTFIWKDTNKIFGANDELYVHIGVLDETDTWQNSPSKWCDNSEKYKMTKQSDGSWKLVMGPTVRDYFGATIAINKIGVVVRNADGTKQTKPDFYLECQDAALYCEIAGLPSSGIVEAGKAIDVVVNATKASDITLTVTGPNGTETFTTKDSKTLKQNYTFAKQGDYTFTAKSTTASENHEVSAKVTARGAVVNETRPAGTKEGINIINDNTVTFVLFDCDKNGAYSECVFWVGDNTDWDIKSDYLMKRDNTNKCWWITINGLEPGKEYAFQYHVIPKSGNAIRFADPYSTKILDPWNDKWIDKNVYPNLREFPAKAWEQPATVFKTTGSDYKWEVTDFTVKNRDNLVIYELLLRDFTTQKSLKAAMEKLPYLQSLGVNAIELMPVQEFDGNLSWGYNPAYFYALDKAYGTDEDYRKFIDECHKLGIAVFFDVVYNHATGNFPYCKLWWDSANNKTSANNPWFNVDAPHPFSVFHDFNHEVPEVKEYIKRNLVYLLEEYKIDGFRFDLTKGFTNRKCTESTASNYDQSRINILKEYNAAIKAVRPDACMILEHLCAESEEKVLAQDGMICWRNMNNAYCQSAMGYQSQSAVAAVYANGSNMPKNGLVGYMESHDEERTTYKAAKWGVSGIKDSNSNGSDDNMLYDNVDTNLATRMDQAIANVAQFLTVPGPKMIWQFGELGYDYSINYNGDRTAEKPVKWEYAQDPERHRLWMAYAKLNTLRNYHAELFTTDATFTYKLNENDWTNGRFVTLTSKDGNKSVVVAINLTNSNGNYTLTFPKTGTWTNLLTDETIQVSSTTYSQSVPAHSCVIYTNFEVTGVEDAVADKVEYSVYPNPASDYVYTNAQGELSIYNVAGNLVRQAEGNCVEVRDLPSGMYILNITNGNDSQSVKFIKK